MDRRSFLQLLAGSGTLLWLEGRAGASHGGVPAASIPNDYYRFLPGERESLAQVPQLTAIERDGVQSGARVLHVGELLDGWLLLAMADINGALTAVMEKRVTYRGSLVYLTMERGVIATIPTFIGDISTIRPRPVTAPKDKQLVRTRNWTPGSDVPGEYILGSPGDPSWETVAALGPEFLGWSLVANESSGPERSLFLTEDGTSRELNNQPPQSSWAPDELSPVLDPREFFPSDNVQIWRYQQGWSKRSLLGGYLPVANTAVWNPEFQCGYEITALLPDGEDAQPKARVLIMVPEEQVTPDMAVLRDAKGRAFMQRFTNGSAQDFFAALLGIWERWHTLFETSMPLEIPDENLRDSARAGIMLARCSYRGLHPTYQIGEGAYTKIPESSHALFPVASYEFIWAQQVWGLAADADRYFDFYLQHYILPDGNFLYNTLDQVEAPLDVGFFLRNAARGFFYTRDLDAFKSHLPVLERMLQYVVARYEYTRRQFDPSDPHHGLIWGSPEADLGDPHNDFPASHPFFFQNAAGVWRGVNDFAEALHAAAALDPTLATRAAQLTTLAASMRQDLERSLRTTMDRRSAAMKEARITPFTPEDTHRDPKLLLSYENHRFMQDWFLADWGDRDLDLGHLRHRRIAGLERAGLHMDGGEPRTSNFMAHGTLAVKIRQEDYRSFLLTLYALLCFAADSGNRYSPEDALIPGGYAGEGNKYWWSAVVNSVLQPTLGLRWLLCYEESDQALCHLQKAAPCEWFAPGERIHVGRCPTRWGAIGWTTEAETTSWTITLLLSEGFAADLLVHIHPPDGRPLRRTSSGELEGNAVRISARKNKQQTLRLVVG